MNAKHKIFADEFIKSGDKTAAYTKAYPKANPHSAQTKGGVLLKNVEISTYIKQKSEKITAKAENKAIEELKDKIVYEVFTAEHKKNILAQIAKGEIMVMQYELTYEEDDKGHPVVKKTPIGFAEPNHDQRIKAIAIHNLMTGDNAAVKSKMVDDEGKAVTPVVINWSKIVNP